MSENTRESFTLPVSGRSRSIGTSSDHSSGSRQREPRLSLGAGIRDLERRTAIVPALLRYNIHNVIEEIRPIMERARNERLAARATRSSSLPNDNSQTGQNATAQSSDVILNLEEPANESPPLASDANVPSVPVSQAQEVTRTETVINIPANTNGADDDDATLEGEYSAIGDAMVKYIPFIIIIAIKFVLDHFPGIFLIFILFSTFYYCNQMVKKEVSRLSHRTLSFIVFIFIHTLVAVILVSWTYTREPILFYYLGSIPQHNFPKSMSELIWSVVVTDFILKLYTVIIKAIVVSIPQCILLPTRRGKWFSFVETTSQLYRSIVPVHPWLHFLINSYEGAEKIFSVFLCASYMVSKGNMIAINVKKWWNSILKLCRSREIGPKPTKEQIVTNGNQCSICHEEFKEPVLLECGHIFCELCVSQWLDREQTCPLCRAKVSDDPAWRDGSTSHFIQVY